METWSLVILLAIFGVAFVGMAFYRILKRSTLEAGGCQTMGVVRRFDRGDRGSAVPIIEYRVEQKSYTVEGISSTPPIYRLGQKVTVLYNPDDPREASIESRPEQVIDTIFLMIGMILLLASMVAAMFAARR